MGSTESISITAGSEAAISVSSDYVAGEAYKIKLAYYNTEDPAPVIKCSPLANDEAAVTMTSVKTATGYEYSCTLVINAGMNLYFSSESEVGSVTVSAAPCYSIELDSPLTLDIAQDIQEIYIDLGEDIQTGETYTLTYASSAGTVVNMYDSNIGFDKQITLQDSSCDYTPTGRFIKVYINSNSGEFTITINAKAPDTTVDIGKSLSGIQMDSSMNNTFEVTLGEGISVGSSYTLSITVTSEDNDHDLPFKLYNGGDDFEGSNFSYDEGSGTYTVTFTPAEQTCSIVFDETMSLEDGQVEFNLAITAAEG